MYNEADNAEACVRCVAAHLATIDARSAIVAVDDGSRDGTSAVLARLRETVPHLIVETHERNAGYGAANRTGFAAAIRHDFDYVLVMDADGTQLAAYISQFLEPMTVSIDFIKATRYAEGGGADGVPWRRQFISWAGNRLARAMLRLPLTDYTNGFRAIRTGLLARMNTTERGFAMLIEEVYLAKRLGATFAEVPYRLTVRATDGSRSKFIHSWRVYRSYLKYVFKR